MLRAAALALLVSARECQDALGLPQCYELLAEDANYYCNEHFCETCEFAGYCDTYCGLCDDSRLVEDCDGNYAPSSWIGDGRCDSDNYLYDSVLINFNCLEFDCDDEDCLVPDKNGLWSECETAPPSGQTPAPTPQKAITPIADVQFKNDTASDLVFYDYDCYKSPLEATTVRVRGIVTGRTLMGMFVQDASMVWSGIYVSLESNVLQSAIEGTEVEVRGNVYEQLGETRLDVADGDVTLIAPQFSTLPAIVALPVTTAALGGWGARPDFGCWASAEPYEGVLVTLSDVYVVGVSKVDQRVDIVDASGKSSVLSSADYTFNVLGYLETAMGCVDCSLENLKIGTLTGVVAYVDRCLYYATESSECIEENKGLTFSSVVLARSASDIQWPDDEDVVSPPVPVDDNDDGLEHVHHISDIQVPIAGDDPLDYECAPSPWVGMIVKVDAVVTAVDDVGFFMQDRPLPWSGIYVLVLDNYDNVSPGATVGRAPGDAVRVQGLVVEHFGVTTIEAFDVTVFGRNRKVEPLDLTTDLGRYSLVASQGCDPVAEQFESMLVIVSDVSLGPTYDDARCYDCFDAMPVSYGDASGALVDDYLYPDLKLDIANDIESSKLELATLTGVVRYAYECEHRSNPVYCTTGQADFYFAYVLSPRAGDDLQAGDEESANDSTSANARRTMLAIVLIFAFFLGLLVATLYIYRRRFVDRHRVITQRCEREIEVPMAHATQIIEAPCASTYVSPVSRRLRLTPDPSFWEVVVPARLEHLQEQPAFASHPDQAARQAPQVEAPNETDLPVETVATSDDACPEAPSQATAVTSVVDDDDVERTVVAH